MDIAAFSIAMSQSVVNTQASMAILKLQMNNSEEMAGNMTDMLKTAAVEPGKGGSIDQYV